MSGHGSCGELLCGKMVSVTASSGKVNWATQFASCGVPNQCGTDLIKNECWGFQSLTDGYIVSCGTGIENCVG